MNTDKSNKDYDILHKIVLIGDSAVGKTSLLQRFAEQYFQDSHITTIGVDFKLRTITVGDVRVKLQVWDTAGQEKFRVITKAYYRNASGILIVYDVTCPESFVNTKRWIEEVKDNCGEDVAIILVGNKCDAPNKVIALKDQEDYAKAIKLPFFETSAKENINIDEVFTELTRLILEKQARLKSQNDKIHGSSNNSNSNSSNNKDKISLGRTKRDANKNKKCC